MKKIYKRIIALVLTLVLCLGFNVYNPKADARVSVSATSSVSIGGSVSVSVSVSGDNISAYTLWISYDSSVLQFNSGSGAVVNGGGGTVAISGTAAGTVSLSFTAIANGTSGIYSSGEILSIEGEMIPTSYGSASVTVSTPDSSGGGNSGGNSGGGNSGGNSNQQTDNRSSNCYLSRLEVSPGTLEPEFSSENYEYTLRVEDGVNEIAINAIPDDNKASTSVKGAKDLKSGENTVEIIVTAENGAVKKYILNVIVGDILEDVIINIDGVDYKIINSDGSIQPPENYTQTTIKYDKWDIIAYESPNKKIILVPLLSEFDKSGWFIYNEDKGTFTEYKEYSSKFNRYIILPFPENAVFSDDYILTEVNIFGSAVPVYRITDKAYADKYIFYGMNIDGEEGYYVYDDVEKTFMRYVIPEEQVIEETIATPIEVEEESDTNGFLPDFLTTSVMFYIICGAGALLLILIICLIAFGVRIGKLNKELDSKETKLIEDDMDAFLKDESQDSYEEPAPKAAGEAESGAEEIADSDTGTEEITDTEDDTVADTDNEETAETEPVTDAVTETESGANTDDEPETNSDTNVKEYSVEEIPVVDITFNDVESMSKESDRINSIVNDESYDAEKDSAF